MRRAFFIGRDVLEPRLFSSHKRWKPESSDGFLGVFALSGQRIAVLHQRPQQAGYHRLHWDGRDAAGHSVASGAYLYRLVTDEAILMRKLTLLR